MGAEVMSVWTMMWTSICGLPMWIVSQTMRPMVLLSLVCVISNPSNVKSKMALLWTTLQFLTTSRDKKWSKVTVDPASHFASPENGKERVKRVIFVRHGESTWNDTFNAGDRNKILFALLFVPNLLLALAVEYFYFVSGRHSDSWFYDSPLSDKGVRQSQQLRAFLAQHSANATSNATSANAIETLTSPSSNSIIVCSNLRRAISTAAIGLSRRLSNDKILLLPCLQEISKNPDALSILPPSSSPHTPSIAQPTWCDHSIPNIPNFSSIIDTHLHTGNKSINSNGLVRMQTFCQQLFELPELADKDIIVAVGHSLFFRSFFQTYLPFKTQHISKSKKIVNAGVVQFTLKQISIVNDNNQTTTKKKEYMIDPESIEVIYGGFGKHSKK